MTRRRILIVDDEPRVVQLLAIKLREAGFEVVAAADGCEALEAVREQVPDLVISDLQMPRMNGVQLLRHLQEDPDTRGVPVLIITAGETALDSCQLPADTQVLSKPFSPGTVVDAVVRRLATSSSDDGDHRDRGVEAA